MIKFIVSDLDGTLFKGHGETIFDLTSENANAIMEARKSGIQFAVASGRTYHHGKCILERYGYKDSILCAGLNGSIIYDNGIVSNRKFLSQEMAMAILNEIDKLKDLFKNVQIQDLEQGRAYYYYDREPSFKYKKECQNLGIGIYEEISMKEFITKHNEIGKISFTSSTKEQSFQLEEHLRQVFNDKIGYSRSSDTFLELHHSQSSKANFIRYIQDTYGVLKEEIACVGDSYNDIAMFELCGSSFVLESGDEEAKSHAMYFVKDVAECIHQCIAMNQEKNKKV